MTDAVCIEHTTFALMGPIAHTATRTMPCHCVIFRIGERVILLDTGFGTREMEEPNRLLGEEALWRLAPLIDPRLTAFERLSERGIRPEQVTDIVLTHLDNDHAGGVRDFPGAVVHVSQEELDAFDGTAPRGPYKPYQIPHGTRFETHRQTGETWFGLEARSVPLVADLDLKLVPLPGHTLGHCGVAYRENGKWSLHAGDAYFDSVVHFAERPPGLPIEIAFQSSPDDRRRSLAKLRRLKMDHGDGVDIFCTHDQREFADRTRGRGQADRISGL